MEFSPVYRDEMPANDECAVCQKVPWKPKSNLRFRYELFREFGNGILKSLKKAVCGGKQFVYPTRW